MQTRHLAQSALVACSLLCTMTVRADEPPPQHLVGWGYQEFDSAQMRGLTSISAGSVTTMGIRPDGTVVGWGFLYAFGSEGPYVATHRDPRSLRDALQLAASDYHVIVLHRDRTVSVVGLPRTNQVPPPGLSSVQSISTNSAHSMAVLEGGNVIAWGDNTRGQLNVPADLPPAEAAGDGIRSRCCARAKFARGATTARARAACRRTCLPRDRSRRATTSRRR